MFFRFFYIGMYVCFLEIISGRENQSLDKYRGHRLELRDEL